jgi:hypothetical protein
MKASAQREEYSFRGRSFDCASDQWWLKTQTSICAILLASRLTGRWFMANAKASPNLQALPTSPSPAQTLPSDEVLDALNRHWRKLASARRIWGPLSIQSIQASDDIATSSADYLRNGSNVWHRNSLGRGSNSPASLDRLAQSTRSRYCSNSVISPNHCVPFSFETVTTLGRSHGPRQPLIVS